MASKPLAEPSPQSASTEAPGVSLIRPSVDLRLLLLRRNEQVGLHLLQLSAAYWPKKQASSHRYFFMLHLSMDPMSACLISCNICQSFPTCTVSFQQHLASSAAILHHHTQHDTCFWLAYHGLGPRSTYASVSVPSGGNICKSRALTGACACHLPMPKCSRALAVARSYDNLQCSWD